MIKKSANPVKQYLSGLNSKNSRVVMSSYLSSMISIARPDDDMGLGRFDCSKMCADELAMIKAQLQNQGLAPSSINTSLAAYKGVAKEAWKEKLIKVNDYQDIKGIPRIRSSRIPKGRALDLKELNKLIDYCLQENGVLGKRDAALIALVYGAGLRRQEAADLSLSCYDKRNQSLSVIGKEDKERQHPLNARTVNIIECWLAERGNETGPFFYSYYKGGSPRPGKMSGQAVYHIISKRYKESGVERLTPHDLRRTYATNLLDAGEDIFTVQDMMGHASIETTRIYDQRGKKATVKAVNALPL